MLTIVGIRSASSLVIGVGPGTGVAAIGATVLSGVVPAVVTTTTTLIPAAAGARPGP